LLIFPFLTQAIVDIGIGIQDIYFIYLVLPAQLVLFLSSMATACDADQIVVIEKGEMAEIGNHETLVANRCLINN